MPRIEFRLPKDHHITEWILNLEGDRSYHAEPTVTFTEVIANRYTFEKQGTRLLVPESWFPRLNRRTARDTVPIYEQYFVLVNGFQRPNY